MPAAERFRENGGRLRVSGRKGGGGVNAREVKGGSGREDERRVQKWTTERLYGG